MALLVQELATAKYTINALSWAETAVNTEWTTDVMGVADNPHE